jgi:hypothetical protein
MLAGIFIIVCSSAMLIYWLRYTCLLLVKSAKAEVMAGYSAFSFPRIRRQLEQGTFGDNIERALDRDYAVLTYLLSKVPVDVEARLLVWDYRLMRCWYAMSNTAFPAQGRHALQEMTDLVAALASKLKGTAAEAH